MAVHTVLFARASKTLDAYWECGWGGSASRSVFAEDAIRSVQSRTQTCCLRIKPQRLQEATTASTTFHKGARLEDAAKLFNSSLEGNVRRAIELHTELCGGRPAPQTGVGEGPIRPT